MCVHLSDIKTQIGEIYVAFQIYTQGFTKQQKPGVKQVIQPT